MSISERKLEANRNNAQKSTGPQSPAMKEKVSQNRLVHGLGGRFKVLKSENQQEFDDMLASYMEAEQPIDDVERDLVVKMARHTWMSERAVRLQEACFLEEPQNESDIANKTTRIAVRADLEVYLRYQTTSDRAFARAAADLAKRKKQRQLAAVGFERQKRAEAEEIRRAERQLQRTERHAIDMSIKKERLKCAEADSVTRSLRAADILQRHMAA
ncbi:MAG: hypothetical protein JO051_01265 [Acidobacteriaceae bacterium]|nr:hypothetical protein [Acidobacteriaceae bacterium]